MSRQLLQWLNPRFTDNLSCVIYRELLSHKILKGHLPCASAIRSVIKIDSTALTRADGVFIASVVAFLQKFLHNFRNPIFAELQPIFWIRVFLTDLWQFPSNGLVVEKPLGEILHVSTPHSTANLTAEGSPDPCRGMRSNKKRIGISQSSRSAVRRDKQETMLFHLFTLINERSYLVCSRSLLISFYRTDCDVGGRKEAGGWIKTALTVK